MALVISPAVAAKIGSNGHGNVTEKDVIECFENHCGRYCTDSRPEHQTASGAPSLWFVAETNHGRCLKIMLVFEHGDVHLKSAYPATERVQEIFAKFAK